MLAHSINLKKFSKEELDTFLSKGYFRMSQNIFTTNFLSFGGTYYSAIWLRIQLIEFKATKAQKKVENLNKKFTFKIKPFEMSPEKELLFYNYRNKVSFEASDSLQYLLFKEGGNDNIFDTYEVGIYDNDKLIALGIFDIGANSSAGITCFYDHNYKKYSLGKYLIYLKVKHSKAIGLRYFYPGYFVPNYTKFDYKLGISDQGVEFLKLSINNWTNIKSFKSSEIPLELMGKKLETLKGKLLERGINCKLLKYLYFDAALNESLMGSEIFDYPVFLYFFDVNNDFVLPCIVYNIDSDSYQLNKCISIWKSETQKNTDEIYATNLLQILDVIVNNDNADEMVTFICN